LSETPNLWADAVTGWEELTSQLLTDIEGEEAPDANDRFMILQTILGAWPLELIDNDDESILASFAARIQAWAQKALREAKRHTSWVNENADYEGAASALIDAILAPRSEFIPAFRPLAKTIAKAGTLNSLSRLVLKCTVPGVPDFYQGTEHWDFSLVDPDNRRPVNFDALSSGLSEPWSKPDWRDGRIKQHITAALLRDRAAHADFYRLSGYEAVAARGPAADHVIGFRRTFEREQLLVLVPRLAGAGFDFDFSVVPEFWKDTAVEAPEGPWIDLFSGERYTTPIALGDLFQAFPFAVLRLSPDSVS
jgi:(1->4)-alpha-D-glucan 1-alpha-D-glucosylmutase